MTGITIEAVSERLNSIDGRLEKIESHLDRQNGKVFELCIKVAAMEAAGIPVKVVPDDEAIIPPTIADLMASMERAVKRTWISVLIGVLIGSGATLIINNIDSILKLLSLG